MEKVLKTLKELGLDVKLFGKEKGVYNLTAQGINNIFSNLWPLLIKYCFFLYWKSDSFNLLKWVKQLIEVGGHHTYQGLNLLIVKIYNNVNKRIIDKEVWIERLNIWLQAVNSRRAGGHYYIYPLYVPNTRDIRGWQVRFATSIKFPEKLNKAFMCSTYGGSSNALNLAIEYREIIIKEMLERESLM